MLQKLKKSTALIMCILMCISMLTCIVLPVSAATAEDTTPTDPYVATDAHTTVATVVDGKIKVNGTEATVPDEFKDEDILIPDDRVYFYNTAWSTPAKAGVTAAGDYFIARYGNNADGSTWGNGKVYLLQYGVNAFGGSGAATATYGEYTWPVMQAKLQAITPTVGGDNNYYVLFFPGKYGNSSGTLTDGKATGNRFTLPETDDPSQADLMNVHYLGPQAGVDPTAENTTRSTSTDTEMIFTSTLWLGHNVVSYWDGITKTGTMQLYLTGDDGYAASYVTNLYASLSTADKYLINLSQNNATRVFHMEDSYVKYTEQSNTKNIGNSLYADEVLFNNVVFEDIYRERFGLYPPTKGPITSQFLGETSGTYSFDMTNCEIINWECYSFMIFNGRNWADYVDAEGAYTAQLTIDNNNFKNIGSTLENNILFELDGLPSYKVTDKETGEETTIAEAPNSLPIKFTNNYVEVNPEVVDTRTVRIWDTQPYNAAGADFEITGNTFKATLGNKNVCDFYSSAKLIDLSYNLFLDGNNNVRVPHLSNVSDNRTANYKVLNDLYASGDMVAGIKDIFTAQETTQGLLVVNSYMQVIADHDTRAFQTYGTDLLGSITVMPVSGETYYTEDLFVFKDEEVEYLGVFSDPACTQPVEKIEKGFSKAGTELLYVKARYESGGTTATAVYVLGEPAVYNIWDDKEEGSFTFDGITYTPDFVDEFGVKAKFYYTWNDVYAASGTEGINYSAAASGNFTPVPMKNVMILMPNNYSSRTITKSVAILGPKFGVTPTVKGSDTGSKLRSSARDQGEALMTARWDINTATGNYVTMSGMSREYVANNNACLVVQNTGADVVAHVNYSDMYLHTGGLSLYSSYDGKNGGYDETQHDELVSIYASDCYIASGSSNSRNMWLVASYVKFKDCVFSNITPTSSNPIISYMPMNPAVLKVQPLTMGFFMENCEVYSPSRNFMTMDCKVPDGELTPNGYELEFKNNIFENIKNTSLITLTSAADDVVSVDFSNNIVRNDTVSNTPVILTDTKYAHKYKELSIDNNFIYNLSNPWNIGADNSENVDDNYYGTADGAILPISGGSGYIKSAWYYVDEKMTTKNTDVQLVDDGYTAFETTFDGINNTTITSTKDLSVADLKAVEGATILGVYSDAAMTTEITDDFDEDGTYYVNIQKTSTSVAWPTKLTLDVPCKHLEGTADETKRVAGDKKEPTCGTDGYQKYKCSECDSTVDAWTVTIHATGEHDLKLDNTHAEYVAPTCTTKGTNVKVCQNADCEADGTPYYETEEVDTVDCIPADDAELEVYAEANCKTEGIKAYKCKWCGNWMISTDAMDAYIDGDTTALSAYTAGTDYEIIAKGTHNFELVAGHEDTVAATCTSKGVAIYVCSGCSDKIEIETDMLAHQYKATVTTPATCVAGGEMTYECGVCQGTYTEAIPGGTGHDCEAAVTTPATCIATGVMTYSCKNCDYYYTEDIDIDPNNHSWNDGVVQKAATCVATGEMLYTCKDCTTSKTETIPINSEAHKYGANVTKEPTCTEDGEMTYTCANGCQSSYTEVIPNKGGHKYNDDDWTETRKATCTREGEEQRLCTVCSTPETRPIAMIDHIWDTKYTVDVEPTGSIEGWKSRHCKLCDAKTDETSLGYCAHANINDEWHIEPEVTCTTDGSQYQLCDDCGDKVNETVIPMLGHDYVDTAQISAADCLNGAVYSTACANCGDISTRTTEPNGHSDSIWFTTQEPTCTTEGVAIKYCTECQVNTATKAIPATAHAAGYSWIVINNATCTTAGLEAYACVDCGEYDSTRQIAAIGHQDVHVNDVPATCTEGGFRNYICTVCDGEHYTEIPATGHTAGEWQTIKIATTLGTGEQVKYCTICNEVVESEVLEQIICTGNNFADVADNAWYESSVNFVYCSSLMNGTTETKFAPTASTTRGMFVTILGRLSGIDATKYTDKAYFEDVRDGSYYFGYIEWARQNGIVEGTGNFVFQPDRAITRQEMCKIIISYADYEQVELENKNVKITFTDDKDIANWAKSFVYEAQRAGIVSGDKVGTFRPKDTATRAEVATLIKNFCANYIY